MSELSYASENIFLGHTFSSISDNSGFDLLFAIYTTQMFKWMDMYFTDANMIYVKYCIKMIVLINSANPQNSEYPYHFIAEGWFANIFSNR